MVIPNGVLRVSLLWKAPSSWPKENAVNTFHMHNQLATSSFLANPQYVADQLATKLTSSWSGISTPHSSSAEITAIKTYLLDTTGHTTAEGFHAFASGTLVGGGAGNVLPLEVALVVSEYGYLPGGFAHQKGRNRGRMFLPYLTQAAAGTNGKVQSGLPTSVATAWAGFFNAANTIESDAGRTDPMGVVILSRKGGTVAQVLHVGVDDHFDVQRSRQEQDTPVKAIADVTAW